MFLPQQIGRDTKPGKLYRLQKIAGQGAAVNENTMKKVKYLIIGAGVAGLTAANMLSGEDYLVLEKESVPGGYCRTIRRGEYVWDYGGHFFHFSHPDLKARFQEIVASEEMVHRKKNTKIYYHGEYVDYPFQKNIHQLTKEEMIDCLYDLFEKPEKEQYDHFLDMLYGKFGKSITEKFLRPYNEKLYACDLRELDVDAMGRFFPYADVREIVRNMKAPEDNSYNQRFLYPKMGAAVFIGKLLEGIEETRLHLNETVRSINIRNRRLETDQGTYAYDFLISSVPLNEFTDLTGTDLSEVKSELSYNQVLVLNLGFDRAPKDKDIHWIYIPDREINFYRAGFYNNIIGTENLSMYIEIGYPMEISVSCQEIERQLTATLENLKNMGILDGHRLVDWQPVVMNPAYVHITQKGQQAVSALKEQIEKQGVFLIGRYGSWRYCSIEDCMVEAMEAAGRIAKRP